MDRWAAAVLTGAVPMTLCSTPLKLRDLANQGGGIVSIYQRSAWVDLSSVSFDNKTSSYTVGACSVDLASQASGGGSHYPDCLTAGCVEDTMDAGWDNVISSVIVH